MDKPELTDVFEQLVGIQTNKPFECVGSTYEARLALKMLQDKMTVQGEETLPYLVKHLLANHHFLETYNYQLTDYNLENDLPKAFELLLKNKLEEV